MIFLSEKTKAELNIPLFSLTEPHMIITPSESSLNFSTYLIFVFRKEGFNKRSSGG